jgi:hypothetical protein
VAGGLGLWSEPVPARAFLSNYLLQGGRIGPTVRELRSSSSRLIPRQDAGGDRRGEYVGFGGRGGAGGAGVGLDHAVKKSVVVPVTTDTVGSVTVAVDVTVVRSIVVQG